MIKKLLFKILYSIFFIYFLDITLSGFNIFVPINYYTIGIVVLLGIPGLIFLSLSFFFFM